MQFVAQTCICGPCWAAAVQLVLLHDSYLHGLGLYRAGAIEIRVATLAGRDLIVATRSISTVLGT